MAEIKLNPDDSFFTELKQDTQVQDVSQITSDALALYKWAVEEKKNGRIVLSTSADGTDAKKIAIPTLSKVQVNQ